MFSLPVLFIAFGWEWSSSDYHLPVSHGEGAVPHISPTPQSDTQQVSANLSSNFTVNIVIYLWDKIISIYKQFLFVDIYGFAAV